MKNAECRLFHGLSRPGFALPGDGIRGLFWPGNIAKNHLRFYRKLHEIFVIFSEFMLDKQKYRWYHSQARVGGICGFFRKAHCDDAGDCSEMR